MSKLFHQLEYCFVGSLNPVKLEAIKMATAEYWPKIIIKGFEVDSGVSAQPRTDEETYLGALARAKQALTLGLNQSKPHSKATCLGLGLEGGVLTKGDELWSTVWVVVTTTEGKVYEANGARFKVPNIIAQPILRGEEMGPVLSRLFDGADIRHTNGAIGVVTRNFVTRAEEYGSIAKLALGLWYGAGWDDILAQSYERAKTI